jgi:hypothetical protein
MIAVLGVSKKEVDQAVLWLSWADYLGDRTHHLVVMYVRSITLHELDRMRHAARHIPAHFVRMPDEQERGYPGSASHLFVRSLEHCENNDPGEPILWLETDAIPLQRGWMQAIADEYATCGMPFLGHLETRAVPPHMAGVGVYPWDWRRVAPRIIGTLTAPDHHHWLKIHGPGCGQAWDMWAGKDILPQARQSRTIQQVWQCPSFTDPNVAKLVKESAVLFHQSKDGALIRLLWGKHLPREWTL